MITSVTIDELLGQYAQFLEIKYPTHFTNFEKRIRAAEFSCRAEAAAFSLLKARFNKVILAEDVHGGGADFLCERDGTSVLVEVTALDSGAVEKTSGLKDVVSANGVASSFHLITALLRHKAVEKASQVANHYGPRLLIICSEHIDASLLMGITGAEFLLTSDTKISFEIGAPDSVGRTETDLKDSVFFRWNEEKNILESCRRSISAIALCCLDPASYSIVGLLHPDPAFPWIMDILPRVPFARVVPWPPERGRFDVEWVIYDPLPLANHYREIKISDDELRSI